MCVSLCVCVCVCVLFMIRMCAYLCVCESVCEREGGGERESFLFHFIYDLDVCIYLGVCV